MLPMRAVIAPRRRVAFALSTSAIALALPMSASAAPFKAVLHAPNHTPTANVNWPITVTVTRDSVKLNGSVRYEFISEGKVVAHRPGHSFKHGRYFDTLVFPSEAVGYSLTLRVLVSTKYGTVGLNWAVKTLA
jgi:hypothetical protein